MLAQVHPIIFLTASRQPGLRDKAMALGAAGFLEKPFEAGRTAGHDSERPQPT
jgi:CheY-like chemotaxis protein